MMQNIFLHHNALTFATWQAQWLYVTAILTSTLQHSTSCCDALSLPSQPSTLLATGRRLCCEAKGVPCHTQKKERESQYKAREGVSCCKSLPQGKLEGIAT